METVWAVERTGVVALCARLASIRLHGGRATAGLAGGRSGVQRAVGALLGGSHDIQKIDGRWMGQPRTEVRNGAFKALRLTHPVERALRPTSDPPDGAMTAWTTWATGTGTG
jgi:hypothetical protein